MNNNNDYILDTWKDEDIREAAKIKSAERIIGISLIGFILVLALILFSGCAQASESIDGYSIDQWANAIYKAEGGAKTAHPYGILAHYSHTTPRSACKNTIRHKYSLWLSEGRHGTFLAYLGGKYCPVGATNDPNNLNINWTRNVFYWLRRS